MKKKAYILGAGPTGLITAWKLLEKNWNVVIIEKNSVAGGLCRSWKWKDFIIDVGPHIFHTPDKKLKKFWLNNFKELLLPGNYWCKNVKGETFEKFYDYPLSIESLKYYDQNLREKIQSELKKIMPNKRYEAKNYKQYIDSFIGPTLRGMFFEKYPKKIWGIDTSQMTPEWAPHRIKFRNKIEPFYSEEFAAVGKYGTGSIYNKIAENILKLGGQINYNQTVKGLDTKENKIIKIKTNKKNYIVNEDDLIISSLPLNVTSYFLGKKSNLSFRGICSVYLFYNKKSILPKKLHWLYYDSESLLFNRITENKKLSKFICPDDQTYLTAEITYSKNDAFSKLKKEEVMKLVQEQIKKTNLTDNRDLFNIQINYEPFVYPVQFSNFKNEVAKVKSFVESHENLFSIGAGGEFNYADSQILFHKSFDLVNSLTNRLSEFSNETKSPLSITFNNKVRIGNKIIGNKNKCFIIAEAGLNHNGSLEIAKRLIDNAKEAGCNAIKFQSFLPNSRVSKEVKSEKYVEKIIGTQESISQLFNRLSLTFNIQKKIFSYARKKKIDIFSTPFDFKSADFLEKMGVNLYKIASADLVNLPLIEYVAKKNKPIILSTGMSKISEIDEAVEVVRNTGNKNLMLLHCNSAYPSNYSEMNLKFIDTLKKIYNVPIGLSDHTTDLLACKVAISRGCNLIEKHFTLSKNMEGPDHILSSDFSEMKELVECVDSINLLLGDGVKKIQPNEYITLNAQKKSLYALRNIKKGAIFNDKNISIKGPAGGILPKYKKIIINKKSKTNIAADQPITWEDV